MHNPGTPAKPLADRLRPLLRRPVSRDDDLAIDCIAAITSAGPSRRHELPDALLSIKGRFLEAKSWGRAQEEIAGDLGCCARTLDRELSASNASDREKEEDAQSDAASRPDTGPDEITASSVEIATARIGRLLTFHRKAETAGEYTARSLREAHRHFPQTKAGPHAGAVAYLLAQAANLGITAADLSMVLNTN
jgi:hypothetical protein